MRLSSGDRLLAVPAIPENEIDTLYGRSLDEFTAARDKLARGLREAGDKAAADEVKALRKPTISAWAINQLVRKERMRVRSLLVAGEKLRSAHADLLGGGGPAVVREASEGERKAISHLVSSAAEILSGAGHPTTESTLERIATTLRAAAVDEEGRALLEQGRLTRDLDPTGFGPIVPGARPSRRGERGQRDPAEDRKRMQAAEEKLKTLRRRARELSKAVAEADDRVARAQREVRAAEKEADALRHEYERAESRVEEADDELKQLRRR